MNPLDLMFLMVAVHRAGKAGRSIEAWKESLDETTRGMAFLLANRAAIETNLLRMVETAEVQERASGNGHGLVEPAVAPVLKPTKGHIEAFGG